MASSQRPRPMSANKGTQIQSSTPVPPGPPSKRRKGNAHTTESPDSVACAVAQMLPPPAAAPAANAAMLRASEHRKRGDPAFHQENEAAAGNSTPCNPVFASSSSSSEVGAAGSVKQRGGQKAGAKLKQNFDASTDQDSSADTSSTGGLACNLSSSPACVHYLVASFVPLAELSTLAVVSREWLTLCVGMFDMTPARAAAPPSLCAVGFVKVPNSWPSEADTSNVKGKGKTRGQNGGEGGPMLGSLVRWASAQRLGQLSRHQARCLSSGTHRQLIRTVPRSLVIADGDSEGRPEDSGSVPLGGGASGGGGGNGISGVSSGSSGRAGGGPRRRSRQQGCLAQEVLDAKCGFGSEGEANDADMQAAIALSLATKATAARSEAMASGNGSGSSGSTIVASSASSGGDGSTGGGTFGGSSGGGSRRSSRRKRSNSNKDHTDDNGKSNSSGGSHSGGVGDSGASSTSNSGNSGNCGSSGGANSVSRKKRAHNPEQRRRTMKRRRVKNRRNKLQRHMHTKANLTQPVSLDLVMRSRSAQGIGQHGLRVRRLRDLTTPKDGLHEDLLRDLCVLSDMQHRTLGSVSHVSIAPFSCLPLSSSEPLRLLSDDLFADGGEDEEDDENALLAPPPSSAIPDTFDDVLLGAFADREGRGDSDTMCEANTKDRQQKVGQQEEEADEEDDEDEEDEDKNEDEHTEEGSCGSNDDYERQSRRQKRRKQGKDEVAAEVGGDEEREAEEGDHGQDKGQFEDNEEGEECEEQGQQKVHGQPSPKPLRSKVRSGEASAEAASAARSRRKKVQALSDTAKKMQAVSPTPTLSMTCPAIQCNLEDLMQENGQLPIELARDVIFEVLTALAVAHYHGVVHRKLRPKHVIISFDDPLAESRTRRRACSDGGCQPLHRLSPSPCASPCPPARIGTNSSIGLGAGLPVPIFSGATAGMAAKAGDCASPTALPSPCPSPQILCVTDGHQADAVLASAVAASSAAPHTSANVAASASAGSSAQDDASHMHGRLFTPSPRGANLNDDGNAAQGRRSPATPGTFASFGSSVANSADSHATEHSPLLGGRPRVQLSDFTIAMPTSTPKMQLQLHLHRCAAAHFRAPETLAGSVGGEHFSAVDVWSAGCLFAEMLLGKSFFLDEANGSVFDNHALLARHQLSLIFELLGRPAAEEWPELDTLLQREGLNLRIDSLVNGTDGDRAHVAVKPLSELILPLRGWPEAQAMLAAMLVPNPEKRITAVDALRLPFFAPCRERAWAAGRDPFSVRCIDAGGAGSAQCRSMFPNRLPHGMQLLRAPAGMSPPLELLFAKERAELQRLPPVWNHIPGRDVSEMMRVILIDWLAEVAMEYKLHIRTFFVCVDLVQRCLARVDVSRKKLQLLGMGCMLVAGKLLEPTWGTATDELVYLCDGCYTKRELLHMEVMILHLLDFKVSLSGPTSAAFVVAYGHELGLREETEPVQAALYVAAKMLEAFGMLSHLSSEIAAAALAFALRTTARDCTKAQQQRDQLAALGRLSGCDTRKMQWLVSEICVTLLQPEPDRKQGFTQPDGAIRELFFDDHENEWRPATTGMAVIKIEAAQSHVVAALNDAGLGPHDVKQRIESCNGAVTRALDRLCSLHVGDVLNIKGRHAEVQSIATSAWSPPAKMDTRHGLPFCPAVPANAGAPLALDLDDLRQRTATRQLWRTPGEFEKTVCQRVRVRWVGESIVENEAMEWWLDLNSALGYQDDKRGVSSLGSSPGPHGRGTKSKGAVVGMRDGTKNSGS